MVLKNFEAFRVDIDAMHTQSLSAWAVIQALPDDECLPVWLL